MNDKAKRAMLAVDTIDGYTGRSPGADADPLSRRFVACCTNNGVLHLFEAKEEFVAFTRAQSASAGLVMAWIDEVRIHAAYRQPNCKICGQPTMHIGDVCYSCCQASEKRLTDDPAAT